MRQINLLVADNDEDFLRVSSEFLEEEGYKVLTAADPIQARQMLEHDKIDLAVLDLRLVNDSDKKDLSGLELARDVAPAVPKIILTSFSTEGIARQTLRPALDGLPPAVDLLPKQEGWDALATAIRRGLKLPRRFAEGIDDLSGQLRTDYEDARHQVKINFWVSLGVAIGGTVILFVGIGLGFSQQLATGILGTIAGLVIDIVSVLFFRREKEAIARMDEYHAELLDTRQFKTLLDACDELMTPKCQTAMREKVIEAAIDRWLWFGKSLSLKPQPMPANTFLTREDQTEEVKVE